MLRLLVVCLFSYGLPGVLADLDPPGFGPPGPNPLADMVGTPRVYQTQYA